MAYAVAGKQGSPEAKRVILCREFGWTIYDYLQQPEDFINECWVFLIEEGKEQERRAKAAQRKRK